MESFVFQKNLLTAHEPMGIPLTRPTDTLSPTGGEGWGEGERFMGSPDANFGAHWNLEPSCNSWCTCIAKLKRFMGEHKLA